MVGREGTPFPRVRVCVDRGGTFTDVFATILRSPSEPPEEHVLKLLSVDPAAYSDAPTEAIRRVLRLATGDENHPKHAPVDTTHLEEVRMGTTVATNALLERDGCRTGLIVSSGLKDVLAIGTQARPDIFDLSATRQPPLYEAVAEARERVIVSNSHDAGPDMGAPELSVEHTLDLPDIRAKLKEMHDGGVSSLAVALMHSYGAPDHERAIAREAKAMGFDHVSTSSGLTPMVKLVPRAFTAVVDAYLTPKIKEYLQSFRAGFQDNLDGVNVQFMRSDGGLCAMDDFSGYLAILSGPAGGVVGYAKTAYAQSARMANARPREPNAPSTFTAPQPVVGFDMGGTSTDVSRYDGHLEHVFETQTAGVSIQAPQLDITTVAAGGGSRLFFRSGLFVVGPESAGAHPGPVCYRKGGHLSVTDANLLLGRIVPELFPKIFGENADMALDVDATRSAFEHLTAKVNGFGQADSPSQDMTPEQVALGFLRVANEAMCRPIRQLTEAKGHDVRDHMLASFGGAGGQHACAVARSLGIRTVFVHRYSGILSAYGIALSDSVVEKQEPMGVEYTAGIDAALSRMENLAKDASATLTSRGIPSERIRVEEYLNLRYDGTDFAIMIEKAAAVEAGRHSGASNPDSQAPDYALAFVNQYHREHGFTIPGRPVTIDDVRVRVLGTTASVDESEVVAEEHRDMSNSNDSLAPILQSQCYFEELGGFVATNVYRFEDLVGRCGTENVLQGPAIVVNKDATIVVDPGWSASVTDRGDLLIEYSEPSDADQSRGSEISANASATIDRVKLSIFGHRFMGIAEQMGRVLQRTAISTNIKERLDFSCALFDPTGGLVANAPHVPVHLGSMQDAVRSQIRLLGSTWQDGEVLLCNHPTSGGTHLPDVTVITPVFHSGKVVFYVASRGHQADIGGIAPGSMPPFSKSIADEGMAVESMRIVKDGEFQEAEILRRLEAAGGRCNKDVISDLRAQVAANQKGISLVQDLIRTEGLGVVHSYMSHIQTAASDAVKNLLRRVHSERKLSDSQTIQAEDFMDDGTRIALSITIDRASGTAVFDFAGSGGYVEGNTNAPRAIASSAIIYALRSLVGESIPMNQGCLDPVDIRLPVGSILNPPPDCSIAGGNVLTSQRITDVILRAFQACAASQGCMNNLTFGDDKMGYYETIAGGAGAGPTWDGQSGIHTHMTNTRITDPEILERRYPAIVRRFGIREQSGGKGHHKGGDGVIRQLEFTRPVTVSILSERRGQYAPYGLHGGEDGARGANSVVRANGEEADIGGKNTIHMRAGESLKICTPGGGGYGSP